MRHRFALALLVVVAAARAQAPEDPVLLEPDLAQLDPGVRQPLAAAKEDLAAQLAAPVGSPRDLARAYGRLGLLYTVCDLRPAAAAAVANAQRLDPSDFRWPYVLGLLRRLDGAMGEARSRFEQAAALAPDYAPLRLRLGDVLYDLGEVRAAEARYREALRLDPTLAGAEAGLGRLAYDRGEAAAAVTHFERALALQPSATTLRHSLGLAYRALGDLDRARRELAANRAGRLQIPDPVLGEAAAQLDSSQGHFSAGIDAMRSGEPERALVELERALAGRPDDALVAYNLGLTHRQLGDRGEAERWLRRALELDPALRDAQLDLGELLAADGRLIEAGERFQRAHELDPDDVAAHVAWAKALAVLGERERALVELNGVVARAPESAEALLNRGVVEAQLGRGGAAEASLRAAADLGSAAASAELGLLFEQQDRLADAESAYREALAAEPGQAEAGERLARLLGRTGRFTEAAAAFGEVLTAAPDRNEARLGQALALLLAGQGSAARATLEEGLVRQPASLPIAHLLARVLAASPQAEVRDGERALALAQDVLRRESTAEHAETVSMALAELGRTTEAAEWQEQVVAQLADADPTRRAVAVERLERYRRGEPVRAPWRQP